MPKKIKSFFISFFKLTGSFFKLIGFFFKLTGSFFMSMIAFLMALISSIIQKFTFLIMPSLKLFSNHFSFKLIKTSIAFNIFSVILIGSLLCSCKASHEGHEDHEHERGAHTEMTENHQREAGKHIESAGIRHGDEEEEHHDSDEIILPVEKAKAAGVKVMKAEAGEFNNVIKCTGKILPAAGDEATVSAPVAGIVTMNGNYTEGMSVGNGTVLFSISTSGLPEGDYRTRNQIAYNQAKIELDRAEKLKADKLITEKEYQAAKAEYERARLSLESIPPSESSKGIAVKAPIGGYVKDCLVTGGEYVNVGQPLMQITRNKNLFLRAEVPEREYDKISSIRNAKFRPSYNDRIYDVKELGGRLVSTGSNSGSTGAFIPLTFEFNNIGAVVPGSYVEIYLIGAIRENVVSVPVTALTEEQGVYFVYVRVDEEGYVKREVKTGGTDGEKIEIVSGLNPGEEVVTEGAVHVKLASASSAIPSHSHNH